MAARDEHQPAHAGSEQDDVPQATPPPASITDNVFAIGPNTNSSFNFTFDNNVFGNGVPAYPPQHFGFNAAPFTSGLAYGQPTHPYPQAASTSVYPQPTLFHGTGQGDNALSSAPAMSLRPYQTYNSLNQADIAPRGSEFNFAGENGLHGSLGWQQPVSYNTTHFHLGGMYGDLSAEYLRPSTTAALGHQSTLPQMPSRQQSYSSMRSGPPMGFAAPPTPTPEQFRSSSFASPRPEHEFNTAQGRSTDEGEDSLPKPQSSSVAKKSRQRKQSKARGRLQPSAPAPVSLLSAEELRPSEGRATLSRLLGLSIGCSSDARELYSGVMRLVFYLTVGRTVWTVMTREQQDATLELCGRRAASADAEDENESNLVATITQLCSSLREPKGERVFRTRLGVPEDVDSKSYDWSHDDRDVIDGTLSKLWTMLLSGATFSDTFTPTGDTRAVLADVHKSLKMVIELTTRAEIMCMTKILWPRYEMDALSMSTELSQLFVEDLSHQLEQDGHLSPTPAWIKGAEWERDLSVHLPFKTAALPQKTYSQSLPARIPDSWKGLQTEAITHHSHSMNIPVAGRGARIDEVVPGLADFNSSIRGLDGALEHLQGSYQKVSPDSDDIEVVQRGLDSYRKQMFNNMLTLPSDATQRQKISWQSFLADIESGALSLRDVEALSFLLSDAVVEVHKFGIPLNTTTSSDAKRAALDDGIVCSERMDRALHALWYEKALVLDVKYSDLRIRFVSAPKTVEIAYSRKQPGDTTVRKSPVTAPQLAQAAPPPSMQPRPTQPGFFGNRSVAQNAYLTQLQALPHQVTMTDPQQLALSAVMANNFGPQAQTAGLGLFRAAGPVGRGSIAQNPSTFFADANAHSTGTTGGYETHNRKRRRLTSEVSVGEDGQFDEDDGSG